MKEIKLTRGYVALVDDEDYERLSKLKWHVYIGKTGINYALVGIYDKATMKTRHARMHRMILNPRKDQIIDHINGNGLDNRKSNLRFATKSTNAANSKKRRDGINQYKGVDYRDPVRGFRARINVSGKAIHLGHFNNEIEAAKAYNQAAIQHFGEFAKINEL